MLSLDGIDFPPNFPGCMDGRAGKLLTFLRRRRNMSLIVILSAIFFSAQLSVLPPDKSTEKTLQPKMTDVWPVQLEAGQYFHLSVEQKGIDVELTLADPGGKEVSYVNFATGTHGQEEIYVLAGVSGLYQITVRARDKFEPGGRYVIQLETPRMPTSVDISQVEGQQAYLEGLKLQAGQSSESIRRAVPMFAEAAARFHAAENWRAEARAWAGVTRTFYSLSDFQGMIRPSEEALVLWRKAEDPRGQAESLTGLGAAYFRLGEAARALDYYGQALQLRQATGDRSGGAAVLASIAVILGQMGEYQRAIDNLREALDMQRTVGDRRSEAPTLADIGAMYRALGEFQTAIEYYEQALPLLREREIRSTEATALANMGAAYDSLDQKQKALELYNESLELAQKIGDRFGEAAVLNTIGKTYASMSNFKQAHEYHDKSAEIMRDLGDPGGEAKALSGLGGVYASTGDYSSAVDVSTRALKLARDIGDADTENAALYALARAYRGAGNPGEARARIEESLQLVETSRAKVLSSDLRASYFATLIKQYEFYIDLLMQLHSAHPSEGYDRAAFEASERAHARNLLDMLRVSQADVLHDVDPALLSREREIRRSVNEKAAEQTRLLSRKHSEAQAGAVAKELRSLLSDYDKIQDNIREIDPRYSALASSASLSLPDIRRSVLDSDSALLEFSFGEDRSFLWVLTPERMFSFELPKRAAIEQAARSVYDDWQHPGTTGHELKAAKLSHMLLAQAYNVIRGKRLLIVADGVLHYIPFGALPAPGRPASTPRTPLIAEHEVISLPSASTLALLRKEMVSRKPPPKVAAIFADPVFSAGDPRVENKIAEERAAGPRTGPLERSAAEIGVTGFERLLSTRNEAKTIRGLSASTQILEALDFDAARQKVLTGQLEDYRIIHFATHGLINSSHPELSGLVLSLVDAQGKPQNGFLRMNEIYGLKLRSDLVVLSACQTALGKDVRGEGLIGLTRGFMYAGSPRVVASLWRIPDRATSELMKRFYEGLFRDGLRPAAALRAAQLDMSKTPRWSSPYYWAGFILQGEWK